MIKTFKFSGSEYLPSVILDKARNEFKISGLSIPEDSYEFYRPIIAWVDEYVKNPNLVTHFYVFLEYFNSSSVKQIFFLLPKLEAIIKSGKEAKIFWHYKLGDDLIKTKGVKFKELLHVPFELVEHDK